MTKTKNNFSKVLERQAVAGAFWNAIASHAKKPASIDDLVRKYTAAKTLDELCELGKKTDYRPSIYVNGSAEKKMLADAYDARQAELGDPRRAFRGW
jgi:hypothetical protein